MKKQEPKLRWTGSNAAMKEHFAAVAAHPVVLKTTPKNKLPKNWNKLSESAQYKQIRKSPEFGRSVPYDEYLLSDWWQFKRCQKLRSCGFRCEKCPTRNRLHVHHLNYHRLWKERNEDLQTLCAACHRHQHLPIIEMNEHFNSIR
jgi:hypothetical protein